MAKGILLLLYPLLVVQCFFFGGVSGQPDVSKQIQDVFYNLPNKKRIIKVI